MPALKGKRELFAHEYVVDGNGTNAAIRAKYTEKSAHVTASRLLKDDKVLERIEELRAGTLAKIDRSGEEVIRRFWELAEKPDEEIKPAERTKVLENLGKIYGVYEKDNEQSTALRIIKLTEDEQSL